MGLEGYVRLGFRKEMEAIEDPVEREEYYQAKVAELYANGKAVSIASVLEIDEVIDPAETRHWIMSGLRSVPKPEPRSGQEAAVYRCVVGRTIAASRHSGARLLARARNPYDHAPE